VGKLTAAGSLEADGVMAKCPSKYDVPGAPAPPANLRNLLR
jgi:cytochrome c-type biogenesis protein CcmE